MRSRFRTVATMAGLSLLATSAGIVGASSASAATPVGGCWVYTVDAGAPLETTAMTGSLTQTLASWGTDADYNLTTSGATAPGGTRNVSLTFNTGPTNGGPAASGTAYYYFSVNGSNLAPFETAFNAPAFGPIPGGTVNGSFPITASGSNEVRLRKVIYDIPSFGVRVQCNGQTSGANPGVNPVSTPVDTNIATSFNVVGPTATIASVSNQVVTTAARRGDAISFDLTLFGAAGTGTVELCNVSGTACDTGAGSVSIASDGTGSGSLTVPAAATTGSRSLKVTSGSDVSLTPITILGNPTVATNVAGGGAGTVVTVTGTNWDPSQAVTIGGFKAGPPFPPGATTDPTISATANAAGNISATFTVNDSTTAYIGGSRVHGASQIFASTAFSFSGDACTAKVGLSATGSCALLETVDLTVVAGDLKMSKEAGNVAMSGVSLDGTDQTSTGNLQDVTVKDYRGGTLGWSLVGRFSGLTGPAKASGGNFTIAPSKLTWTPSCDAQANNDDTVVAGSAGSFADASTDLPLCAVATSGLGADGTSGGDAVADAGLSLEVGASQAAGAYTGLLTLTLS